MLNEAPNKSSEYFEKHTSTLLTEEKCTSLYGNLPASIAVSVIIAIILSIAHWDAIGHAEVIIWNLILGSTLVARLITWVFWNYTRHAYPNRLWIGLFRIQVWLTGLAWGLSAYFLFSHDSTIHQALLAFSIAGVASGSLTSLTIDRISAVGFVITTVFPLSLTLYQQSGPGAFYMLVMSVLFIFFVLTSTNRAQRMAQDRIIKNIELIKLANELKNKQHIEDIIKSSQSKFIQDKNSISALQFILQRILKLSGSSIGFIGKIKSDEHDKLYMKALIFAGEESVEQELMRYHAEHLPAKGEFRNLDNLFGSAIESGKPVISNAPQRDLRSAGLPPGHPRLNNFIALPIYIDDEKIALLSLANNIAGYSDYDVEQLNPILNTIAQFVEAVSNEEDHARDKAALNESSLSTKIIMDNVNDGIITINKHGRIQSFNHAAETIFGYKREKVLQKNINILMPDPEKTHHQDYINQYLKTLKGGIINKGREVVGLRKNGETFPMELFISMVMHNNEPLFIGIIRDNSEKNKHLTKKNENFHEVLKELAIQHLVSSTAENLLAVATPQPSDVSHGQQRANNLYRLITRYFFIDHNNARIKINLLKHLKDNITPLASVIAPIAITLAADERRNPPYIECDETLLEVCFILLLNNLIKLGLERLAINVREEKSMAKITFDVIAKKSLALDEDMENLISINGYREKNSKNINALLALYNGKITLDKAPLDRTTPDRTTTQQLVIYIEFPLTTSQ